MLMLYGQYQSGEVDAAVELALEKNIQASDGVQHILLYANEAIEPFAPLANWMSLPSPDLTIYGELGGVQ